MQGLYTSQATLPHTTCSQHNNVILPSTFDMSLEASIDRRPRQPESDNARLTGAALRMIHRLSSIFTLTGGGRWCDRRDANGWSMVAEPDRSQRGVWWRAFCVGRGQLPSSRSFQVQLSRTLGVVYSVRTVYRGRLYPSMAAGSSSSLWGLIRRARGIRAGPVTSVGRLADVPL